MQRLLPGRAVPDFAVELADGSTWRLSENPPDFMLMIDIYRGVHCPRCRTHLETISTMASDFADARLEVIAVSTDSRERADRSRVDWAVPNVRIGHGLSLRDAQALGLFLSHSIESRPLESPIFAEPGVLFVRPDLTLYGSIIQTFPFARPKPADLLEVATFVAKQGYPPRGDHVLTATGLEAGES